MEDDQKNPKWKTTKQQPNSIQFKNKIVQIGCGSAPGNLVNNFSWLFLLFEVSKRCIRAWLKIFRIDYILNTNLVELVVHCRALACRKLCGYCGASCQFDGI